jgi:response regulator RpfG family c-di-GMP phosphodiesterase
MEYMSLKYPLGENKLVMGLSFKKSGLLPGTIALAIFFLALHLAGSYLDIGEAWRNIISDTIFVIVSALTTLSIYLAAKHTLKYSKRLARAWRMTAIGMFFMLAGNVAWLILDNVFHASMFPSLADIFFFLFYIALFLGLLHMPAEPLTGRERIKVILDICAVSIGATLIYWNLVIGPLVQVEESSSILEQFYTVAFPALDLVLLWVFIQMLFRRPVNQPPIPLLLLGLGAFLTIVSDSLSYYQVVAGTYVNGGFADNIVLAGMLLAALAGVVQISSVVSNGRLKVNTGNLLFGLGTYSPYIWITAGYLLLVWAFTKKLPMSFDLIAVGVGLIIILSVIQQALVVTENSKLYSHLWHLNTELEKSIEKRTSELVETSQNLDAEITQRIRIEEQVVMSSSRSEALLRVAERLNAQLEVGTILDAICEETAKVLNIPVADVALYDARREALIASNHRNKLAKNIMPNDIPLELYQQLVKSQGPVIVIPDLQDKSKKITADLHFAKDARTVCYASMLRGKRLIGALCVVSLNEVRSFSIEELALLKGLSNQAAQAIANAQLFEEGQRRLRQIQALRDIEVAIKSSMDLAITQRVIMLRIISLLRADAACLLIFNPQTMMLEYGSAVGFRTRALQHTNLRLGEGYAGQAALKRRILHIPNFNADSAEGLKRSYMLGSEGFTEYFALPLITKGEIKGVLEIFHHSPLDSDEEELDFLEALAAQAALAIENSLLFNKLQQSNIELTLAYEKTLESWSRALDQRDKDTEGHTQRVTDMTVRLARTLGVEDAEMVHIRRGAALHDIGNIGIPDQILQKSAKLTDEEWEIMRKHPSYAYDMLSDITFLRPSLHIPYCHHEKWDGTGYPRGLSGEQIPYTARIFSVVDVWDALRSDRPYRKAWSEPKVSRYIREQAGKQFDPHIAMEFLKLIEEN